MKTQTKYRIIAFVKRLLNLRENEPPYIIEERKIQRIRLEHILSPHEKELLNYKEEEFMDHLKRELAINMVKVIQQIGSIRYEIDTEFNSGNVKITATTYVPEKL